MIWKDPPPARAPRLKYAEEVADLRANPGQWGMLERRDRYSAAELASRIRMGRIRSFEPAGDFEAVTNGKYVHVRYLGDGDFQ